MDSKPRHAPPGASRPVDTALPDVVLSVATFVFGTGPDPDDLRTAGPRP